jgi:uncharacterized membrane protein
MTPDPSNQRPTGARIAPKHILFCILGLMMLFVISHNERFILDHSDPLWSYYLPVRWLLVFHGAAGAVAIFLGASQFSTRLRQRQPRVHRVLGRLYVASVAVAAPLSIGVTVLRNEPPLQIAIYAQATLWLLTTAVAFYCVRRRNYQQHRQWMIRSYAITLIFLADRVLDAVPGVSAFDTDASPGISWLCNVIAWVVPTFIISWPRITRSPAGTATSPHRPPELAQA